MKNIKNIEDLQPNPNNHNKGTERGTYAIRESIQRLGAGRSGLADKNGKMIAGNHTLQAIADLDIPVKVIPTDGQEYIVVQRLDLDLDTDLKATELSYADNRTAQLNLDVQIEQLISDIESGADLSYLYTENEIKNILDSLEQSEETVEPGESDRNPENSNTDSRVQSGDIWQVADQIIVCADASIPANWEQVMKNRDPVNLFFTSPPYASQRTYDEKSDFKPIPPGEYVQWFKPFQENAQKYLASDGSLCINIKEHCEDGQRHLYVSDLKIAMARQWGWQWIDELIWYKNGFPGRWDYRLRDDFERVFHFSKGKPKFFADAITRVEEHPNSFWSDYSSKSQGQSAASGNYKNKTLDKVLPGNVIKIAVESEQSGHPASFPVALPEFFIKAFTEVGDLVVDVFAGSGTTLVSAQEQGRQGIGFEISPMYCAIALARLSQCTNQDPRKIGEI